MAAICVTPSAIAFLKQLLRERFSGAKSSHLSEAIASALGFKTNMALVSALERSAPDNALALLDCPRFVSRMKKFGYQINESFDFEWPSLPDAAVGGMPRAQMSIQALKPLGEDNGDLYYLVRALQERNIVPPALITLATLKPLLGEAGMVQGGRVVINVDEYDRILAELGEDEPESDHNAAVIAGDLYTGVVSFRAECHADVTELARALKRRFKGAWEIAGEHQEAPFPDVEVEMTIRAPLTIRVLHAEMERMVDGHVMAETLRALPLAQNSLERRYSDLAPGDWAENGDMADSDAQVDRDRMHAPLAVPDGGHLSAAAARLYEYCKTYQTAGRTDWVSVEEVRQLLIPANTQRYGAYSEFKRRVLNRAVLELEAISPVMVAFEEMKAKRQVTHLRFSIAPRPGPLPG